MTKKKYAMVGIASKVDDNGVEHMYRVLIEYQDAIIDPDNSILIKFTNTRIVAVDPYFEENSQRSHRYLIEDDGYTLIEAKNEWESMYALKPALYKKRTYHLIRGRTDRVGLGKRAIFLAASDEDAIKKFRNRPECYS